MNTRTRYFSNHIFDAFHLWSVSYVQVHNIHRAAYHPNLPSDLFFFDLIYHVTCPTLVYAVTVYQHSDDLLALSPSKCSRGLFYLLIFNPSLPDWEEEWMKCWLAACYGMTAISPSLVVNIQTKLPPDSRSQLGMGELKALLTYLVYHWTNIYLTGMITKLFVLVECSHVYSRHNRRIKCLTGIKCQEHIENPILFSMLTVKTIFC